MTLAKDLAERFGLEEVPVSGTSLQHRSHADGSDR